MKKKLGGQLALTLVSLVLGLMLATQFRNVQRVGGSVSLQRTQELTRQIQVITQENLNLEKQLDEYQRIIQEFEDAAQNSGQTNKTLLNQLEQARIAAGITDLVGPGIIVTVDTRTVYDDYSNNHGIIVQNVHYDDLLKLVNELNAAGAEAVSINGERIIATTEIRNVGSNFIIINTKT